MSEQERAQLLRHLSDEHGIGLTEQQDQQTTDDDLLRLHDEHHVFFEFSDKRHTVDSWRTVASDE